MAIDSIGSTSSASQSSRDDVYAQMRARMEEPLEQQRDGPDQASDIGAQEPDWQTPTEPNWERPEPNYQPVPEMKEDPFAPVDPQNIG